MNYKVYFVLCVEVEQVSENWARLEAEEQLLKLKLPYELEFSEVEENEYYDKNLDLIVKGQRGK